MHEVYARLGITDKARYFAYRELFRVDLGERLVHDIQRASSFSMPLGNDVFQQQISAALGIKLGQQKLGRPLKKSA